MDSDLLGGGGLAVGGWWRRGCRCGGGWGNGDGGGAHGAYCGGDDDIIGAGDLPGEGYGSAGGDGVEDAVKLVMCGLAPEGTLELV